MAMDISLKLMRRRLCLNTRALLHAQEFTGAEASRLSLHLTSCSVVALFFACLAIAVFLAGPSAQAQSPDQLKVNGYVSDFGGVLSQSVRDQLTALCTQLDQKAQAQIAIVTIKSLGGRPIEDYSIDLATRLGIGPKGQDRGVLILLAVDDHKDRIEVGYGLEPILTDGKTGSFLREAVPYLREGNYDAGVMLITRRVADVIAADRGITLTNAAPLPVARDGGGQGQLSVGEIFLIIFGIFIVFSILRGIGRGGGGRYRGGSGWWIGPMIGGAMGRGGWGGGGFGGGFGGGGGGFGGFGGGGFGGGGASGGW